MSGPCPGVVKKDKMNKLCLGTYLQALIRNKSDSPNASQANIGRTLLKWFDPNSDKDDSLISHYANSTKNPSRTIIKRASTIQSSSKEKFVAYFDKNIMPLLNPNKINQIVRILSVLIAEDGKIESGTVIDKISNIKKEDLKGGVDDAVRFLAGVYLYALSCTDNLGGKKEKGFVARIMIECEQLSERYVFGIQNHPDVSHQSDVATVESSALLHGVSPRMKELSFDEERMEQEVRIFCIDHDTEMALLPLCQVIAVTDPMRKHVRKMYNDFCKCTSSVQKRILSEKNVTPIVVSDKEWWYDCLDRFILDYRRFELGSKDYEYMFGHYIPKALYVWQDEPVERSMIRRYKPIVQTPFNSFANYRMDIEGVIDEYMYYKDYNDYKGKFPRPMDFFFQNLNFGNCDEPVLIMYLCQFILGACSGILLSRRLQQPERDGLSFPDVAYCGPSSNETETLEDLFFATLRILYRTYMVDDEMSTEKNEL